MSENKTFNIGNTVTVIGSWLGGAIMLWVM
jgi:hypothetical protein